MFQIFLSGLVLSIVHAAIPNHWLPIVALSKSEVWNRRETLRITAFVGAAHTISTIFIGIIVGFVGSQLSAVYEVITSIIAPLILCVLGITYIILDRRHKHQHKHFSKIPTKSKNSQRAIVASLAIAMFFSPCLEVAAYYFSAGTFGWIGIVIVSLVYFFVTTLGMVLFVALALKGVENIEWHYLERHEKKATGLVLIALGIFAYFTH